MPAKTKPVKSARPAGPAPKRAASPKPAASPQRAASPKSATSPKPAATAAAAPAAVRPLPLFYTQPEPLNAEAHGKLRLKQEPDFAFAAKAHAIPIAVAEFAQAAADYPIVFVNGNKLAAVAIVGVKAQTNLFVTAQGGWREGHYIPAYVRRYPFILTEDRDQGRAALCVDTASSRVMAKGKEGASLFEDGKASPASEQALAFCAEYQKVWEAGRRALPLLKELNLLRPMKATLRLKSGDSAAITDFWIVDEAAVNSLSDDGFLKLRRADLLGAIYCALLSQSRWARLAEIAE